MKYEVLILVQFKDLHSTDSVTITVEQFLEKLAVLLNRKANRLLFFFNSTRLFSNLKKKVDNNARD